MPLERYRWSALTNQQVGAFVECIVEMELTMFGFQVYATEVDDRGVDFNAQFGDGPFLKIQVKSVRSTGYILMEKSKFLFTSAVSSRSGCFWMSSLQISS
jgi:hypothetical protein